MGHRDGKGETGYGLLGSLKNAGEVVGTFVNPTDDRLRVRAAVKEAHFAEYFGKPYRVSLRGNYLEAARIKSP